MTSTNEQGQSAIYREVISEIKRKGTNKQDGIKLESIFKYRRWLKVIDSFAAGLAIAGLCNQYYLTQILFYESPQYTITDRYNSFCYLGLTFTLLLLICIVMHHIIKSKVNQIKKSNIETEGFKRGVAFNLIIELLLCSVTSLPNVNVKWTGTMSGKYFIYHITDIFMMIMLLKSYLIMRLYEHYSKWTSFNAYKICKKYSTNADAFFGLKSDLKDRPFLTIGAIMGLLVIIFGIATQQSEKSYDGKCSNMDQLTNSEWLIIITMTTVGYGDIFPTTHLGRFFCLLACISGMILVSAMVVALNMASEFNKDQSIAYLAVRTKNREHEWYISAAEVIKAAFRKAKSNDLLSKYKSMLNLRKCVFNFKRKTELNALMDITSAEMLYDLQHKLEGKLLATKSIICDIPRLSERCENLMKNQKILDQRLEKVMQQQRLISSHLDNSLGF